jgi:dihydrofolate reductase
MRQIVCQMMTNLNGRVDDPMAFTIDLADDQYRDIDSAYATFDTILVGRVSYEEMVAYWPGALNDEEVSEPHRNMARRMDRYRKIVITRSPDFAPTWRNSEAYVATGDEDLVALAQRLRGEEGADIHLSGGARLAQSFARLGLVDRYRLYVNPTVSEGEGLFAKVAGRTDLTLSETRKFENGVTVLDYSVSEERSEARAKTSFDELIG